MDRFIGELRHVEQNVDFFIIDTAAGINQDVLAFLLSSNEIFVVTTGEPTAITDAYAIIKAIVHKKRNATIRLIVNMCRTDDEAERIFNKINAVSVRFLNKKLKLLGGILYDSTVSRAVRKQKPFLHHYPNSPASLGVRAIAKKMLEARTVQNTGNLQDFFTNIKGFIS